MLKQYKLDVGSKVGVSCPDIGTVFDCIVLKSADRSATVFSADTVGLPIFDPGTVLRIASTKILMGVVASSTKDKLEITDLDSWDGKERREFFRQRLSEEATVVRLDKDGNPELNVECKLLDLSAAGIRFSCSENYWMVDDYVRVTWKRETPQKETFKFLCQIVRVNKTYAGNFYGCKFVDLTERDQDDLLRAIFAMQQLERRRRG